LLKVVFLLDQLKQWFIQRTNIGSAQ